MIVATMLDKRWRILDSIPHIYLHIFKGVCIYTHAHTYTHHTHTRTHTANFENIRIIENLEVWIPRTDREWMVVSEYHQKEKRIVAFVIDSSPLMNFN